MSLWMNWRGMWFPLVVITATLSFVWLTNRTETPKETTWEDVVVEARKGNYKLINTDELRARYETDFGSILLVDTRQPWEFAMGHIKGAINFPMEPTAWSRWQNQDKLAEILGPDKTRFIVFY